MSDDLVKSHIEWLRGDHELCNPFLADRIEALEARAEKAEAERDALREALEEARDGHFGSTTQAHLTEKDITSPEAVERLAVTLEETNNWETEAHIKLADKAAATLRALSSALKKADT